jgi:hypothetical protein
MVRAFVPPPTKSKVFPSAPPKARFDLLRRADDGRGGTNPLDISVALRAHLALHHLGPSITAVATNLMRRV